MRNDLVDITMIVDRSGSMKQIQVEAENGINHFIEEQKKEKGSALFTLVQFDNVYEFVHRGKDIKEVETYILDPRGMTALLDSVGRSIIETEVRLNAMKEEERPGGVIFVIITDGQENASCEFTVEKIKDLVKRHGEEDNWQFIFLGSDVKSFNDATKMGLKVKSIAQYNPNKVNAMYNVTAQSVSNMRKHANRGIRLDHDFTDKDRQAML